MSAARAWRTDVAVVGGCGHVGLPLAIAFAQRGLSVGICDTDAQAVDSVNRGELPFDEEGAAEPLRALRATGAITASTNRSVMEDAENVVVVVGTPVDEHLNPDPSAVRQVIRSCAEYLSPGQLLVLRSTVYPGVTATVEQLVDDLGLGIDVAFCPERIAQGHALRELYELPQIVGARTESASRRAAELFGLLTDTVFTVSPEEAELAKLFTNAWRYVKFAAANQFFMMANDFGLDYDRIRDAIRQDYPRADDLPAAGFAAGPCLLKDTMQLAAFTNNRFVLGHTAMLVNEGLPLYIVSQMERRWNLAETTVGVLGMAFKPGTGDTRDSLSYKLRRILRFRAREVLCTDSRVNDEALVPLETVLARADVLVIATPHEEYRAIETSKPIIDVTNLLGGGTLI